MAALLLALGLEVSGLIVPYRLKTLDLLFRHVPLPQASPQVVVVTVDQPDLDFFKNQGVTWPWPRQLYGPIVDFCRRGGARAVIFDILYTEASSYGPEDDSRLAQALKRGGQVALPFFLSREEKPPNPGEADLLQKAGLAIPGPSPQGLPQYRSVITPIPPFLSAAQALGNVECGPDPDGIYRRLPLVLPFQNRWLPILSFAAYHQFQQPGPLRFEVGALVLGQKRLPLDRQGQFLLKFRGPTRSHPRFSAANVIQSEARCQHGLPPIYPPEAFAGKWVLIGLTAPGLMDLKASPVGAVYAGVEIHATLLDNLLQGDFLRPVPWWGLVGLGGGPGRGDDPGGALLPSLFVTLGSLVLLLLAYLGLAVFVFWASWWADPVLPGITLTLSFALAAAYSYATEGRQKLYIRRMFAQYMSETVISHLLEHPEKLKLGGNAAGSPCFFPTWPGSPPCRSACRRRPW